MLACADGSVWLSDRSSAEPPRALVQPRAAGSLQAGFGPGNRAAFTPDGRKVVVAYGPTLSVRDVQDGRELRRLSLPVGHSRMIGFDPLAQFDTETLKRMPKEMIENLKAGKARLADPENIAMAQDAANAVVALAVDREGRLVAVGRQEDISVWNLESGALVRNLSGANMTPVLPDTNAAAR